ncbi:HET domain-containing protein [Fusarium sp. LHS14.1]|nr:HET domain-containing protein [Fusarium sp. LHS14.1]
MRDIYGAAREDFVWLGETTTGLDLIVSCVRFIASQDQDSHLDKLERIGDESKVPPEAVTSALTELSELAWFRRTWVIQEFALPRQDPVFLCGKCNREVTNHGELNEGGPDRQMLHELTPLHPLEGLGTLRAMFSHERILTNGLPLSVLIDSSNKSLATNPRDKVYGLLGLANDDAQSSLTIDYNKSVRDIYEEFTRYLIFSEQKLNILSRQGLDIIPQWDQSGSYAPPGLPVFKLQRHTENVDSSWIRHFSLVEPPYRPTPFLPDWLPRAVGYDASLSSDPIGTSDRQPGELGICGTEVDVVKECQRAWYMNPCSATWLKDWKAILSVFFKASRAASSTSEGKAKLQFDKDPWTSNDPEWYLPYNPKYGAHKTMKEAIWRTLIGDQIFQITERAPGYCSRLFDGYIDAVQGRTGHFRIPEGTNTTLEKEISLFSKFVDRMDTMLYRGSAFSTSDGWIGIGPNIMRAGDLIVLLSGGNVPHVLRLCGCGDHYVLIGECYVEGIMYGEMMTALQKGSRVEGKIFRIR